MSSFRRVFCKLLSWRAIAPATFVSLFVACTVRPAEHAPVAFLAGSAASAAAFAEIRATWGESPPRQSHRARLEAFIAKYKGDELTKLAEALLALACLEPVDGSVTAVATPVSAEAIACADSALAAVPSPPPGTLSDLVTTAQARRLRALGDAEQAMSLLRPLSGRTVDPLARVLFQEELSLAAVATDRAYEAISYMDVWLRSASDDDRGTIVERTRSIVATLPEDVLVGALTAMRDPHQSLGYGEEIKEILRERLATIAVETKNANLARWLRESTVRVSVSQNETGTTLLNQLATSTRGIHLVRGRTLGLLLPTSWAALRDESADVLRGVMWALGLPRGVRDLKEEEVSLVTRDDGGDPDRVDFALEELAGEGASIIIAGLDERGAERAAHWAEREKVPVILLSPPASTAAPDFSFTIGERRKRVTDTLAAAIPELSSPDTVRVVDESQLATKTDSSPEANAQAIVSCDLPMKRAGAPRFPVEEWQQRGTTTWLVEGGPACASDLVSEISGLRKARVVALSLESTSAFPFHSGISVMAAAAGALPVIVRGEMSELATFLRTYPPPVTWWTALGRDAATLAARALRTLPNDSTADAAVIAQRRKSACSSLLGIESPLWSTDATGYAGAHEMPRVLRVIAIPKRGGR